MSKIKMPYTPVCHYYQAGCCRNGDICTFVHPKVRCRTFAADGWCPYGYNCHFWHDPSVKPTNVSLLKKPCQFFANNQCKYGDKCSFSHDVDNHHDNGVTLEEYRAAKKLAGLSIGSQFSESEDVVMPNSKPNEYSSESNISAISSPILIKLSSIKRTLLSNCTSNGNMVNNAAYSCIKPGSARMLSLQSASKEEVYSLNQFEIEWLKKRFLTDKLCEVESNKDCHIFCIKFSSSDPDWVYDVREIVLNITIPNMYPKEPVQVRVLMQGHLPTVLVEHLNKSIESWIRCKHEYFERMKRIEPYLRPLFFWLDRNLEEMFTEGLRKYKALLESGEFGQSLSAVPTEDSEHNICQRQYTENQKCKSTSSLVDDNLIGLIPPVVSGKSIIDDEQINRNLIINKKSQIKDNTEFFENDKVILNETGNCLSTYSNSYVLKNERNNHLICDQVKSEISSKTSSLDDYSHTHFIHPIVPAEENLNDGDDEGSDDTSVADSHSSHKDEANSQTDEFVLKSTDNDEGDADPENTYPSINESKMLYANMSDSSKLTTPGTQNLIMSDLRLFGKAGTFLQRRLSASLHCTRCRLPFQWLFSFHRAPTSSNFNGPDMINRFLRSLPPYSAHCARCQQKFSLLFQANLAHAFDKNVGTLHLDGCIADDVPPKQSDGIIYCTECFSSIRIVSLGFDHPHTRRCFKCHSIVGLEFSKFCLELIKQPSAGISKTGELSEDQKASRRLRRALNSAQNALIQDGSPLPAYGTCKHYRKSYRWLRFPCCGRLEPCDVCHDNSAVDGHEMELATRMICGFCSKEQRFSAVKPCIRCGKTLSGSRSSHWEGGKGCRNRVTMSRKDSKKYSQVDKVPSKKKTSKS
ncbi:unnamed protein product [Trichobilharzia szidati]|nr:unnamed protein product [Trichobilharzia szidati]